MSDQQWPLWNVILTINVIQTIWLKLMNLLCLFLSIKCTFQFCLVMKKIHKVTLLSAFFSPSNPCFNVATLALGSRPRHRGYKVAGEEEGNPGVKARAIQRCGPRGSPRVTSHTPGSARKCKGVWGNEHSHSQGNSHFGKGSPRGLPKLQRAIRGVKTQWHVALFISMEISWNVDV
jgi:hypothetical protein